MKEASLFGFTGQQLSELGQQLAIENANDKVPEWSELAFNFLKEYIKKHDVFMAENIRSAAKGIVPDAPSARAWGGIMCKAKFEKLIVKIGIQSVKNPQAHSANANLWQRV